MSFALVGVVAFLASGLTLYSGFGLGTVLLPAFAVFFPAPVAVAATAVVHLLNNLFKGTLLLREAHWPTVARFGLPAVPAAIAGAFVLAQLGATERLFTWTAAGRGFGPSAAGLTVGVLMIAFAALELQPWFQRLAAPPSRMPLGGVATGFIGGLTGQQGALRSMFLLKSGLEPKRYVATGVMIAVIVDLSRVPTYALAFARGEWQAGREGLGVVAVGTVSAFAGAYLGVKYLRKATIGAVRLVVATLMFLIGSALAAGLIGS